MTATTSASVADFIADRCQIGLRHSVRFVNLRGAWILWCLHHRVPAGDDLARWELDLQRSVPELLTVCDADGDGFAYIGIGLKR